MASGGSSPSTNPDVPAGEHLVPQKVLDDVQRIKDNLECAVELFRQGNEWLKNLSASIGAFHGTECPSLKDLSLLISDFEGSEIPFHEWEQQLRSLVATYKLDERMTRLLIASKLKGRLLQWFQSDSEHLRIGIDELLLRMKDSDACEYVPL